MEPKATMLNIRIFGVLGKEVKSSYYNVAKRKKLK